MPKKLLSVQSGIAGEYFVAGELTRRGYVASLTLRNTKGIDILASNADANRSVGIQVKTIQSMTPAWPLNKKAELDVGENLFYIFVCLPAGAPPSYHVVPRNVVARQIADYHQEWLSTPGRGGRPHQDNPMRKFRDRDLKWKDRWDILGLD